MIRLQKNKFSSEIRYALNDYPNWMKIWGILAVWFLLVTLLFGSYLIKYPDIISADVTITMYNPSIGIDGRVSGKMDSLLASAKHEVKQNDIAILNENTVLSAWGATSVENAVKLKAGLKVNIRLDNHPHPEFGLLKGSITDISRLPGNKINFNIKLDTSGETMLKTKLQFSQRMMGKAEIITKDKSLLERIADQISLLTAK